MLLGAELQGAGLISWEDLSGFNWIATSPVSMRAGQISKIVPAQMGIDRFNIKYDTF
jgi:hypothetical protein